MLLSSTEINSPKQSNTNSLSHHPTHETIILATKLSKSVGSGEHTLHILRDLQLTIQRGERVAIVGSSGSGKSTLLGILAGLDVPTSGEITILGNAFSTLGEDARAAMRGQYMGFVFQSFQLLPTMTALENVMIPMQLNGHPSPLKTAKESLTKVGLGERMQHYPKQLSGGEQQRVAIARAFAAQPAVLFADEPTGNLDSANGEKIIDLLFKLNQENNTTLVLVTHDVHLAQQCDRVLTLKDGQLTASV
ncbi:MAG: ABC transporter ATP-binding protein [Methylophilus sp.]|nr:ABC transporter ATP-binding protein [Methylophilus sp.]